MHTRRPCVGGSFPTRFENGLFRHIWWWNVQYVSRMLIERKCVVKAYRKNMLMIISQVLLYFFFHRMSPRMAVITITVIVLITIVMVILIIIIILGTVKACARVSVIFLSSRRVKSRNPSEGNITAVYVGPCRVLMTWKSDVVHLSLVKLYFFWCFFMILYLWFPY